MNGFQRSSVIIRATTAQIQQTHKAQKEKKSNARTHDTRSFVIPVNIGRHS